MCAPQSCGSPKDRHSSFAWNSYETTPISRYDDLFDRTATSDSVFADKSALDPLTPPDEPVTRPDQEEQLGRVLQGVNEGYLPTTVTISGGSGAGRPVRA